MRTWRRLERMPLMLIGALALALSTPHRAAMGQPRYGGTMIVGVTNDADTFNPLYCESKLGQEIGHLVLIGLAELNEKSQFAPELAESWEYSKDFLRLTYHLRKDARWSDGVPITADDVKFTYDLLMDSTVASPRQGSVELLKRVIIQDQHTVVFEFKEAYPDQMFDTAGEILPRHVLEKVNRADLRSHAFGRAPISSGPFVLKKWQSNQYVELAANENYFEGRPYLDRIIFKIVPDAANLYMQLQTGEVDMLLDVPPAKARELVAGHPRIATFRMSGRVYYYLGYNTANPVFADPRVRRALTMAIDRPGIIQALLEGYGSACLGPIPPMLGETYNTEVKEIPFDPAGAKRLLAEAGWTDRDGDGLVDKNGRPFVFTMLSNTGNQLRTDLAVIIQDQLRRVGVGVKLITLEWTSYLKALRAEDLQAYLGGWSTAFNIDPTPVFHSSATALFNYGSYTNPAVDALIERGRKEMDPRAAAEIWRAFQAKVYEDQPYTFLFWIDKVAAINRRIQGATPIALSPLYGLQRWHLEPAGARMTE